MGVSLTGKDSITIDTRILSDFGDGDTASLEFPNNLVEAKAGKNGNIIYAFNAQGKIVNATLRILKGSPDDKYLSSRMHEYINDPSGFILMAGEFVKRIGDGAGNITNDVYTMKGGVIQKFPAAKENVNGETDQAISIYVIVFGNGDRIMG